MYGPTLLALRERGGDPIFRKELYVTLECHPVFVFRHNLGFVSTCMSKQPQSRFPMYLSVMPSSFSLSLMPIYTSSSLFQFLHMQASHLHCLHPIQHSDNIDLDFQVFVKCHGQDGKELDEAIAD